MLTGANGGPQRRGARVRAEDVDGVVHVRVPPFKLCLALWWANQTRGALNVAMRRTPRVAQRRQGRRPRPVAQGQTRRVGQTLARRQRTIHHRRPWPRGGGDELTKMRVERLVQRAGWCPARRPAQRRGWWMVGW